MVQREFAGRQYAVATRPRNGGRLTTPTTSPPRVVRRLDRPRNLVTGPRVLSCCRSLWFVKAGHRSADRACEVSRLPLVGRRCCNRRLVLRPPGIRLRCNSKTDSRSPDPTLPAASGLSHTATAVAPLHRPVVGEPQTSDRGLIPVLDFGPTAMIALGMIEPHATRWWCCRHRPARTGDG